MRLPQDSHLDKNVNDSDVAKFVRKFVDNGSVCNVKPTDFLLSIPKKREKFTFLWTTLYITFFNCLKSPQKHI